MQQTDLLKEKVAQYSFDYLLKDIQRSNTSSDNLIWLGIGSGTTIKFFISILGKKFAEDSIPFKFVTISSSVDSEMACRDFNLPIRQLADLPANQRLNYYIDGADEVDKFKRCLKGLGGASTREKLLRLESEKFYVLTDENKKVSSLCVKNPVVLEILPFGFEKTLERIKNFNPIPFNAEIRKGTGKMGFVITDNNNYLVDAYFKIESADSYDFEELEQQLKSIPGVVETGLFAKPADVVFISTKTSVEVFE